MRIQNVILLLFAASINCINSSLDFLKRYETFNVKLVKSDHSLSKRASYRSVDEKKLRHSYTFKFHQFKQKFDVVLNRNSILTENTTFLVHESPGLQHEQPLDAQPHYHGILKGIIYYYYYYCMQMLVDLNTVLC